MLLGLASTTAVLGQVDAREIIRRAVAAEDRNWKMARNYTFSERVDLRYLDSEGRVKSSEVNTYEVTLLQGSPYRRLTARDDRALLPREETKEQDKLAKSVAERRKETLAQRSERLAAYQNRPEWQREAWRELPEAFDFQICGEEVQDGHRLYVIQANPRRGYQPRSRTAKVLPHVRGKLWVNQQDHYLVKAEVEMIDTIWVGLFLVRLAKGSRASFAQTRIDDEVWLPARVQAFASARVGLLKVLHIEQEVRYSDHREPQADYPIVSQMESK
jgi:hypothetical protein